MTVREDSNRGGLNAVDEVLYVDVKDQKGPLVDNGIEQTRQFAHEVLQAIKE